MKSYLYIIVFVSLILGVNLFAQNKFYFGANTIFTDSTLNKLIENNIPVQFMKEQYNIDFLRYPGGIPARFFFRNIKLSKKAMQLYISRLGTINGKERNWVSRLSKSLIIPDSFYVKFIKYCKENTIEPIIQLNTFSYRYQDNVYPVSQLSYESLSPNDRPNKWDEIRKDISNQLYLTHTYLDTVYWEIGNEDYHIYDPEVFGKIVSFYSKIIKDNYPHDKIILPTTPLDLTTSDNAWIIKLFNYLVKVKSLQRIDFLGPHYYKDLDKVVLSENDIENRFKRVSISKLIGDYNKYLIQNYSNKKIKIFFTEFSVFRNIGDVNVNTQLHALLLCEYMMQFYSSEKVFGVIHHGFVQKSIALFFEKGTYSSLNYGIIPNNRRADFPYIPPQTEMLNVFFENIKNRNYNLVQKNNLTMLVSQGSDGQIIILNYGELDMNLRINDIVSQQISNASIKSFYFDNLNDHIWSPNLSSKYLNKDIINSPFLLKSHSLTFIDLY